MGIKLKSIKITKRRWAWGSEEEFKTFNNMDWENGKALPSYPPPPPPQHSHTHLLWCIITDIPSHTLQSLSEKLLKIPLNVFEIILSKINQNNSSTPLCSTFFSFLENFLSKIFWWACTPSVSLLHPSEIFCLPVCEVSPLRVQNPAQDFPLSWLFI